MKQVPIHKRSAKWVYQNGSHKDITSKHLIEILKNLYKKGLAEAFFVGMGWPEGYHYCRKADYVRNMLFLGAFNPDGNWQPYWHACRFL